MPDIIKLVHPEHGELEFEVPEGGIPGFISEAEHKKRITNLRGYERRKALETLVDPEEILADDGFKARALEQWGVGAPEPGPKGKGSDETAERLRQLEVKQSKLDKDNATLKGENEGLRIQLHERDIITAAVGAKFADPSDAVAHLRGTVNAKGEIIDPATGQIRLNEDGSPMSIKEAVQELATAKSHLISTSVRKGAGYQPGGEPPPAGQKTLEQQYAEAEAAGDWAAVTRLTMEITRQREQQK